MAQDRRKKLETAERLLTQGKIPAALLEFEDLARNSPRDILTLNRVGDVLSKQGRNADAVVYYRQIADHFAEGGFLPKAIAIHKKILRLTPDCAYSLGALGALYADQQLPGEARAHLMRSAELHLQAKRFADARKAYERLVALEPDDPRHRVRLAEARAAEGETLQAGRELISLADWLLARGQVDDADRSYRRAAELLPQDAGPLLGAARCLEARGNIEGALGALASAESRGPKAAVVGARLGILDRSGRKDEARELLEGAAAGDLPDTAIVELFRSAAERNESGPAWERYGAVLARWCERGAGDRAARLYRQIGELETNGHLQALEALYELRASTPGTPGIDEARGLLVRAYTSRSMEHEARALLTRSPNPAATREAAEPAVARSAEPVPTGPAAPAASADGERGDAEAPAVPLTRTDEEFVAGRITQAEILEKYGLRDEALRQLREVAERYPGHVPVQERLVEYLREGAERPAMRDALVGLALARRAAGDSEGARRAATEAGTVLALAAGTRSMLERLGVLPGSSPPRQAPSATAPPAKPATRPKPAAPPAPRAPARAVTIDFDDADEATDAVEVPLEASPPDPDPEPEPVEVRAAAPSAPVAKSVAPPTPPAPVAAARRPPVAKPVAPPTPPAPVAVAPVAARGRRQPGQDMVREIESLLDEGAVADARRRVEALVTLGYEGPPIDGLRARIAALDAPDAAVQRDAPPEGLLDEDDDLGAITAALEHELLATDLATPTPQPESEQSLEDVFAAFRQHVASEIEGDDYRTHYDLGIAYKEMGLLDDAIEQFQRVLGSPDLNADALAMLAVCLRDAGRLDDAARSYRQAIDACRGDGDVLHSLRYELAEVLLGAGDALGALGEFRDVLARDPSFRDVRDRVEQLER